MDLLRAMLRAFLPPIACAVTLVAVARAAWRARPSGRARVRMSVWSLLTAVAPVGTQSLGFLLDPMDGAVAAGIFVVIVLLLRRASAGGFGVAFGGVMTTIVLGFVIAWSIYAKTLPDAVRFAVFWGMLVPCALTALVLLGATAAFVAAGCRKREHGKSVCVRTYVAATSACASWYVLGVLVHWGCTGPKINVTAG